MEIHIENDSPVAGSGTDRSALWTLLAILFFGAFILVFVLMNKWPGSADSALDEPVPIQVETAPEPSNPADSTSEVPEFPPSTPPVTWEGEENTPMGP